MTDPVDLPASAVAAAPLLLGGVLRHEEVAVRITEVEAYEGVRDPASHAWRGLSKRNAVMFGPPGRLYVYTMHGHCCCNVVCSPAGDAAAVLIRAGRVVDGMAEAMRRRPGVRDDWLARGPGCLAKTLGIDLSHAGTQLLDPLAPVNLTLPGPAGTATIACGPRVGVSRAADVPWRFWVSGERSVSGYKRSPRAHTGDFLGH